MKNSYVVIVVIVVIAILAFAFGSKKDTVTTNTNEEGGAVASTVSLADGTYRVDTEKSVIRWTGEYKNGATEEGTLSLGVGSFMIASKQPFMGTFDIDLATLKADGNLVLENFVKGASFLDVDNYPTAEFIIHKVLPNPVSGTTTGKYIIDGKLTIKGKTESISFPAEFSQKGNTITVHSFFALNRADWGLDENKEIRNAVMLELHIEASK